MRSVLLGIAARYLAPVLLLASLVLLLRGHNEPGGGFIGGLVAACAFGLYALALDVGQARRHLHAEPQSFIAAGLGLAALSGVPALLQGRPFLASLWTQIDLPWVGAIPLGTPLWFDVGVFLTVFGVVVLIVFTMVEEN